MTGRVATASQAGLGLVVAAVLALAGCSSGTSAPSPAQTASAQASAPPVPRIATDNDIALDVLIAVGATPACATGDTSTSFDPLLVPYTSNVTNLGESVQGSDFNVEALAKCAPKLIVAPSYDQQSPDNTYYKTAEKAENGIARTVFFDQPNPPVDGTGQVTSTWKNWLHAVADLVGRREQANQVIANLDRRAAAIRGQVQGKTIALVSLSTASAFDAANSYLPLATVYVQDLGAKNFAYPAKDYPAGCLDDAKPTACYTNDLSMEKLPDLGSADAILVQSLLTASKDVTTFESNPLFAALPPVKSGHLAKTESFTDTGPLGVDFEYTEIENAFQLKEFSAQAAGGTASLTLDPASSRLCWAAQPAPGTGKPAGPISVAVGSSTLTLAGSPAYSAAETTYQTKPATFLATGCSTVSSAIGQALLTSAGTVTLSFAGGKGALKPGAASIVIR